MSPRTPNPGSVLSAAVKLRVSRTPPTSSTTDTATCTTTSPWRRLNRRLRITIELSSFSAGTRSGRDARNAGRSPNSRPVTTDNPPVNATRRQSTVIANVIGSSMGSCLVTIHDVVHVASTRATAPPRIDNTRLSTVSCRIKPHAIRAHRRTNGHFLRPRCATRQQHAREVRAGDEQHEADRGEQHQAGGSQVLINVRMKADRAGRQDGGAASRDCSPGTPVRDSPSPNGVAHAAIAGVDALLQPSLHEEPPRASLLKPRIAPL